MHRVLKNFPKQAELVSLLGQFGRAIVYQELQNYWLVEYELSDQASETSADR